MLRRILNAWSVAEYAAAAYPQRRDSPARGVDRWLGIWIGRIALWFSALRLRRLRRLARDVESAGTELVHATEDLLQVRIQRLREQLPSAGLSRALVVESFALIREICQRRLGMKHFPVQIMGGYSLLEGEIAEMATGEGKTLTAVLPAVTIALSGIPVHVVTVNDYLARRDAHLLEPVFTSFGLSVGWIEADQDAGVRRSMYASNITYCVNKDLVFDYLRDGLGSSTGASRKLSVVRGFLDPRGAGNVQLLRGLCFAIVDEADSIFIDEARTPLIISSERSDSGEDDRYAIALELARQLQPEAYSVGAAERAVRLTAAGELAVEEACANLAGIWRFRKAREQLLQQALAAMYLYKRDLNYIVAEEKVQIVDESTGRTMADRSWEHGLHQMIETKEGLATTRPRETISRITYQRFFRRYLRLAGMTGTGAEVAPELRSVFGINTVRIPTHRPCVRRMLGERVFLNSEERWQEVVARVAEIAALGRAVLVGTRSVAASEKLGSMLAAAGMAHALLNARQDAEEADIIAAAGQPGRITVATNMAGRGTDIVLHPEVRAAGGLHVILTEYHESRRIDRQLFGRAARQGDPGSCESLVSLEDDIFQVHAKFMASRLRSLKWIRGVVPGPVGSLLRILAQQSAEHLHAKVRRRTLESERHSDRSLAFSGRGE